jgi:hypothetical protein
MKKILKDKKGSFMFWAVVIVMVLLIIGTAGFEYIRLQVIAQGTRDAVQATITQVCTANYDRMYNGLREGYSGGYKLDQGNWSEDVDTGDLYTLLDKQLGTHGDGSGHTKMTGNKIEYSISNLSVQMTNTPFAPDNPGGETKFTGIANYTLIVPLSFGWQSLPPMETNIRVVSGYTAKF